MLSRPAFCLAVIVLAGSVAGSATAAPTGGTRTWNVRAGAPDGGTGTRAAPLSSLQQVEARSRPGDRIVVLPAPTPLDGGIRLKARQTLNGAGPAVGTLGADAPAPRLVNRDPQRLDGDVVRLADGVVVRNLRITAAARGGIYGRNVTRVTLTGNDVSGFNASCTPGFLIPPFNVPTTIPGVGVPISEGLHNGWAGIMVDADHGIVKLTVNRNRVHDSECGDGIDVRASGTATMDARIGGNDVRELRQGDEFESVLAFGLQTRDRSRLVARLDDNRQSGLGNDEDVGAGPSGADSEGVFVNPTGPSTLRATVTRNRYTHTPGRGGFSANGLEFVSMGDGSRGLVTVRDSTFSGTPGDVIEQLALGTNARLRLRLERVTATGSTGFSGSGFGDTVVIPGNNSDCVIAASGGAGNTVDLKVRDTTLTNCANNGLTFGSAGVNGQGPTKEIRLDIADSRIVGHRAASLRVGNVAALERLSVKIERTDLSNSRGQGANLANLVAEDLGTTGRARIDFGGGALGSAGGNCLAGGPLAAALVGYDVDAARTWWGTPGGPAPGRVLAVDGTLRAADPLSAPPAYCTP